MILNPSLAFPLCFGIQDLLWWEDWVLMMLGGLVSVSNILTFAFRHVVISGVINSRFLWLELFPPVSLIFSVSTPGRPALS